MYDQEENSISGKSPYDQTFDTGMPTLTNMQSAIPGIGKTRYVPNSPVVPGSESAQADVGPDASEATTSYYGAGAANEEDGQDGGDGMARTSPTAYPRHSTFSNDESEMGGFNIPDNPEARKIRNNVMKITQTPIADRTNYTRQPVN